MKVGYVVKRYPRYSETFIVNEILAHEAAGMKKAGHSSAYILGLWGSVVVASALAALIGYLFLAGSSGETIAVIQSFAAGTILTMLASTMLPEAYDEGGAVVGVVTTVGFLVAFVLSHLE